MRFKSLAEVTEQTRARQEPRGPFVGEPSDDQVMRRYESLFVHGRDPASDAWNRKPWLMVEPAQGVMPDLRGGVQGQCCGPRFKDYRSRSGKKAPVYVCRSLLCPFCWMHRMHKAKVSALQRHVGVERAIRFSVSLPAVRRDPLKVKQASMALRRAVKRWGFDAWSYWVHVFGEDLREGPKGHLDGVVSVRSSDMPEADVFKERVESLLQRFCEPWTAYCDVREVEPRSEDQRGPLSHHAGMLAEMGLSVMYSGRDTFRVDRLWAGQHYAQRSLRYRILPLSMTRRDVDSGKGTPYDMTAAEVLEALGTAHDWSVAIPRGAFSNVPKQIHRAHARDLVRECAPSVFYRAALPLPILKLARRR